MSSIYRRLAQVAIASVGLASVALAQAAPCPTDTSPRPADVLLVTTVAGATPVPLTRADLERLTSRSATTRRVVEREGARDEQALVYGGWLLRDVLVRGGFDTAQRGTRTWVVEAVATDDYRAVFSWGELFNSALGDQVYVIGSQDGQALDAQAGPLALRALADQRPGPRHVRNLCALIVRPSR